MVNLELAKILTNLAEINKSLTDDFKVVMNLTTAARTIRDYPGDIKELYLKGKLENLPGINQKSFELIREYFETGKIQAYEETRSVYSDDLINFVRMSGLGKRRVFKIYEILQVNNIDDLKNKLFDKNIDKYIVNYPGLEKGFINSLHIERMIEAINYFEKTRDLVPRWHIENFVGKITGSLMKIKEISKVEVVGSLRRKKSFVKDIDILILPEFNKKAYNRLKSIELIKKISSLNIFKELKGIDERLESASVRLKSIFGIDIELIISSFGSWPMDLIYATGSKNHIKILERFAEQKGLFDGSKIFIPSGKIKTMHSVMNYENLIYDVLGLQYITPELREGLNEIELAKIFTIPKLVTLEDIKGDLHIHSRWSDGLIDIDDILEKSRKYHYEYVAISDHSISNMYGNGLSEERAIEKLDYIKSLKSKIKEIKILMGGEIDIKGIGKLDYSEEMLKKMDFVIGSIHSNYVNSCDENTNRVLSAIENKYVDIIAHPTGVVFGSRAPYSLDIEKIIKTAAKHDKALEINSYYLRLDLNDEYARKVKSCGGKVAINSDSHRPNNMEMIRLGVDVARRAGLEKQDILNALSLKDLRNWKEQRR
jgi:DNA polymerase (family 10)